MVEGSLKSNFMGWDAILQKLVPKSPDLFEKDQACHIRLNVIVSKISFYLGIELRS